MAGKVDIQVAIGADARPLEKEVAKARGSVHGLARDVEAQSKNMVVQPFPWQPRPASSRKIGGEFLPPDTSLLGTYIPGVGAPKAEKKTKAERTAAALAAHEAKLAASVAASEQIAEAKKAASLARSVEAERKAAAQKAVIAEQLAATKAKIDMRAEAQQQAYLARSARREQEAAARKTALPSVDPHAGMKALGPRGGAPAGFSVAQLVRRPEFNLMGNLGGLLGGFTLGGMMMWIRGAEQAAAKSKELARAAKLPTEEFVRLQKAAKDNQIPVETLNDALKDYAEGKITIQEVGEAVGIIGMKAGGASEEVKKLANQIDELAELNKQMEVVQEGASNFGKTITVGLSKFFGQASRMAIESVYQGRAVDWWEAGDMIAEDRKNQKKQENDKLEKEVREKRIMIKVQADLEEFFGDLERQAAKGVKIKLLQEQLDERIAKITVKAPSAGDSLARIGGFMGGRMDNRGLMIAERQLRAAEETAEYTKQAAKVLAGE